jgi:electron transfer flavoprotein alpha subunit
MSLLCVAFDPSDLPACGGLAQALGIEWRALLVTGDPAGGYGASGVASMGLDEVPTAESLAAAVVAAAGGATHVAAVSSMRSKDMLPRAAARLGAAMVTDVVACESATVFVRPVLAGSILARVEALASPVFLTFRPAGFAAAQPGPLAASLPAPEPGPALSERVSATVRSSGRPDLGQAKAIVTGGRPLGDAATFESVIGGLADKLGGAVGATRAAVDSGIAPNELQIGQTGKIVAPDLYIAAGVSGSTQHMAGIKDSKTIVAVNKDPDAPIFEVADLGLVADLFEALPELASKL